MRHKKFSANAATPGFSLIEVIVAIGLLAIFASSLFVSIGTQLLSATGMRQSLEAMSLAREGLEAARFVRDDDWALLATGTHGIVFMDAAWNFGGTSDAGNGFTRQVEVMELSANERQVVTTVSWTSPSNRPRSISLATNLSNWRNVTPTLLSGDWRNPQTLGTADLGPSVEATSLAVRNKIVYMVGEAPSAAPPDFFVIDATNSNSPAVVASLDIGTGSNAVAIADDFAYVANDENTGQLSIINISVLSSPEHVNKFLLAGNTASALSVNATGTLVYIGTEQDDGPELYVIDVSNPAAPFVKSTLEIGASVNQIFLFDDRAFLATADTAAELMVIDISNPNAPFASASVDLSGSNPATGLYINFQDERAYITRAQAGGTSPEISIYNVSNPDAPSFLGSSEFSSNIPAVFAADALMFLGTDVSNLEFQIFDVTNPASIVYHSGLNFPQVGRDIAFEDNIIYAAVRSNNSLRIITSQ